MKKRAIFFKLLILIFLVEYTHAQTPTVKTFIDRDNILIGEQVNYKVVASFATNEFKVNWLSLPDSIPHFELVAKGQIDSSFTNNITTLTQQISLTSFDSGKWRTPALAINFISANSKTVKLYTDSMEVNVGFAPTDSTNQLRDIKPIIEMGAKPTYCNIVLYVLIGLITLLLLIYLVRRFRKNKPKQEYKAFNSAYDVAMESIKKLQQYNLNNSEQVKQYHIALSQIVKQYLTRRTKINMLNKTTDDVLVYLKSTNVLNQLIANVASALRCGDAVKFAKFLPTHSESEECLHKIKNTIQSIHTNTSTTT